MLFFFFFVFDLENILVIWSNFFLKILGRLLSGSRIFYFDDRVQSRFEMGLWILIWYILLFYCWFIWLSWVSSDFEWAMIPKICLYEFHVFFAVHMIISEELQRYQVYMLWIFLFFLSPLGVISYAFHLFSTLISLSQSSFGMNYLVLWFRKTD